MRRREVYARRGMAEDLRPAPFNVAAADDAGTRTVVAAGDLDVLTAERFVEAAGALPGLRGLQVDLRGIAFLDSSGLRGLLRLARAAEDAGVPLAVVPSAAVLDTLEIVGLTDDLPIVTPG